MVVYANHNPLLEARNLRKSYANGYEAVKGINFYIKRGEIFGFLGPNGAGKTTTISMLCGLEQPTSGSILFDISRSDGETARRRGGSGNGNGNGNDSRPLALSPPPPRAIGLVPQELALYPTLSAYDNLKFFGHIYGLRGKRLKQRIQSTLQMVGLVERANDAVKSFSGGMKRRLNFAAGLLHEPLILFLDEPTVGVDPQSRVAILECIEGLNRDGMTILYTTHYMEEAQRLCHRVAIMDHGQIVACDTTAALIRRLGEGVIQLGISNEQARVLSAQATSLPAIKTLVYENGILFVEAHQIQEALTSLLELTRHRKIPITSLQILEPNLETVFLRLTGKRLRD